MTTEDDPFFDIVNDLEIGDDVENIVDVSIKNNVENVIALSTDKAVSPINLYGATKLVSDKIFTSANLMKGNRKLKLSVVRYGNVLYSTGSVLCIWKDNLLHLCTFKTPTFYMCYK